AEIELELLPGVAAVRRAHDLLLRQDLALAVVFVGHRVLHALDVLRPRLPRRADAFDAYRQLQISVRRHGQIEALRRPAQHIARLAIDAVAIEVVARGDETVVDAQWFGKLSGRAVAGAGGDTQERQNHPARAPARAKGRGRR